MLIQDLLQRRNSKRSTAQHIWSMQSEDFCSSVARYRRAAAAGGHSATPRRRRGHSTPTVCCVAKFGSFFSSLDFLQLTCNEDQSQHNKKRTYLLTYENSSLKSHNEGSDPFIRYELIHLMITGGYKIKASSWSSLFAVIADASYNLKFRFFEKTSKI